MTDSEGMRLSRGAYERLKAELEELTTTGRAQIAERLLRARELGDLSENAEYHETKNQQGMMEARIRKLEEMLRNAQILEAPVGADSAVPGTIVTLRDLADGSEMRYLLAQTNEERTEGVRTVTAASPLGQALSGKRVGDKVEYQAPGGTFSYEIAALEPWMG